MQSMTFHMETNVRQCPQVSETLVFWRVNTIIRPDDPNQKTSASLDADTGAQNFYM